MRHLGWFVVGMWAFGCGSSGDGSIAGGGTDGGSGGSGSGGSGSDGSGSDDGAAGNAGSSPTAPSLGDCAVFPADNPWNRDVSTLPVRADSDALIDSIGRADHVHPDFGTEWDGAPARLTSCWTSSASSSTFPLPSG